MYLNGDVANSAKENASSAISYQKTFLSVWETITPDPRTVKQVSFLESYL